MLSSLRRTGCPRSLLIVTCLALILVLSLLYSLSSRQHSFAAAGGPSFQELGLQFQPGDRGADGAGGARGGVHHIPVAVEVEGIVQQDIRRHTRFMKGRKIVNADRWPIFVG